MLDPGFYPHGPASVSLLETHISWVFLAGERVYKVKKPVVLPFLDYGTRDRRHRMCREEVRLNRRLAPRIYLGVAGIAAGPDGYALCGEEDPAAIEHAVRMRRLQEGRSLAELAAAGGPRDSEVEAVAARLARFHAEAEAAPDPVSSVDTLAKTLEENEATLREAGEGILDPDSLASAARFAAGIQAARREELLRRARSGRVRDCHGDLRAEHVIVPRDGEPYAFDCAEFDPGLRRIDVGADLAFLVMDLERLAGGGPARLLLAAYRAAGGDPGDDALLSFLAAYRAWVRAKIACLRADQLGAEDPERGESEAEARELLDLGHRFAWRARQPLLLVVSGMPAAGKSTLAGRLAARSGWPHLSSDLVRKRLAGLEPTERAGAEQYSARMSERTYLELGRAATRELEARGAAIVDATFHRAAERDAFERGLAGATAPRLLIECRAAPAVLLERARRREAEGDSVSDAGAEVVQRRLAEYQPVELSAPRLELRTEDPPERLLAAVETFVDRSLRG